MEQHSLERKSYIYFQYENNQTLVYWTIVAILVFFFLKYIGAGAS